MSRRLPFTRIPAALILPGLSAGILARLDLPAPIAVPLVLGLLILVPMVGLRREDDDTPYAAAAMRAGVLVLLALAVAGFLHLSLPASGWLLAVVGAVSTLLPSGAPTRIPRKTGALVLLALCGVLAVRVHTRPLEFALSSDGPAHVGAIYDSIETGQLLAPERFDGAPAGSVDPRFGTLHGLYALVCEWSGVTPSAALRWAALLLSPLWFLVHRMLFRRLGSGERTATAAAFLFTLFAGAGRGFGLAAVGFPGSVAQLACALALAFLLGNESRATRGWALALLILSVTIHPFAWWATSMVMGLAALLMALRASTRPAARRWLTSTLMSVFGGTLILLPRLLEHAHSGPGLHDQFVDVIFLGNGLFLCDPWWVLRWGGTGAVLALPALLVLILVAKDWSQDERHLIGVSLALPVWLISLDPLLAPVLWPFVSYLVVRLGRIVLTTWVWACLLEEGIHRLSSSRRSMARRRMASGVLLTAIGLVGILSEVQSVARYSREPDVADAPGTAERLDTITDALAGLSLDRLVAEPRMGYGIRLRGGPRMVLPPIAHASPQDTKLGERLKIWRELSDPALGDQEILDGLARLHAPAILVDQRSQRLHAGLKPFAYVPDDARSARLDARLRRLGLPVLAEGEGWTVFGIDTADRRDREPAPSNWTPELDHEPELARGHAFSVVDVELPAREFRRGDVVPIHLRLATTGEKGDGPERIFLRVEGEMPRVPGFARPFSKLWRKLFVERSGRSEHRFGRYVVPAGLVVPPGRWPGGEWEQEVPLKIPDWIPPGEYTLQLTVQDWSWHPRQDLADYLRDEDRFSATPAATIRIAE